MINLSLKKSFSFGCGSIFFVDFNLFFRHNNKRQQLKPNTLANTNILVDTFYRIVYYIIILCLSQFYVNFPFVINLLIFFASNFYFVFSTDHGIIFFHDSVF
jgi:hypothetical protein